VVVGVERKSGGAACVIDKDLRSPGGAERGFTQSTALARILYQGTFETINKNQLRPAFRVFA
jgi:hypothetical protein